MSVKPWKVMLLSMLAVVGCAASDSSDAEDAVDTTQSTSTESALMDATGGDATVAMMSADSSAVALNASNRLKAAVSPASCLTITQNGATVTYVFDHCTGPKGWVTVTGTVTVVYSLGAGGTVTAVATGSGIEANSATLDLNATAIYSKDMSGLETLQVTSQSDITSARGVTGDHMGDYVVTRDDADCRTLDGTWSTDWTAKGGQKTATTSTTASGLEKCGDACPSAGGTIVHHGLLGRVVTVTLDGSATAKWTSSDGKSGTVNLSCGGSQ
jgi:hypothetical protein